MTFAEAFATSVQSSADAPALVAANRRLTYAELDRLADGLAGRLRDLDIAKGDVVWSNSRDTATRVAGLVACARMGSVFVDPPVNWSPQMRAWAWGRVRPSAVFADGADGPVKSIGSGRPLASDYLTPGAEVHPDDPLDLKATSGTTGHPKVAIRTHANHLHAARHEPDFVVGPGTTVALFGEAFTVATATVLGRGASLVLPTTVHADPFLDAARTAGADWLMVPVAFLRLWAVRRSPRTSLEGFKGILAYAGFVPSGIREEVERAAEIPLISAYSMTEAPWCAFQHATDGEPSDSAGRPTSGVEIEVRDPDAEGSGEIVIRGPNVSPGYLGEAPRSRDGWFVTGDIGRFDAGGHLFIHGRTREVIDVAGRKVAPHVVEAVIGRFAGVDDVSVFGIDDAVRGARVAAAVVSETPVDRTELESFCREHLESHEVPRKWVFVDELPQTASGKPDRTALMQLI